MIASLKHNFKSPSGLPVKVEGLQATTLIVGANETGKTAVTQALNAVVYGTVPELRAGRKSGTSKAVGDLGGAASTLRVTAQSLSSKSELCLTSPISWAISTNDKGAFAGKVEREGSLKVDSIYADILAIEKAGEDGAIAGTTEALGWLGLYVQRFENAGHILLVSKQDPEFPGGAVAEVLARVAAAKKTAKGLKEKEEQLAAAVGLVGGEMDQLGERLADVKRQRVLADAEVKLEQGKVGRVWAEVRTWLNRAIAEQSGAWADWLTDKAGKPRIVSISEEGALLLGDHLILSGAGAQMARLTAAYTLSGAARLRGSLVLVTIEDCPFDQDMLSRWPEELLKRESGFQVVITMPLAPFTVFDEGGLPAEMGVVRTPLQGTTW